MKRWAFAVVAAVLGASGVFQMPAQAQSSPGSSAVASALLGGSGILPTVAPTPLAAQASQGTLQTTHRTSTGTAVVTGSAAPAAATAPLYGLEFRYDSDSGWGFQGTVWTGNQPTRHSTGSSLSGLTADMNETSVAADQVYAVDPTLRASQPDRSDPTSALVGVSAADSTIGPAGVVVSPVETSLEVESSPTTDPLEAQSVPVAMPMQAQTPTATATQAQSSGTAASSPAMTFTNTVSAIYWMPSVNTSVVQGSASWTDNLFGLDYRLQAQSNWGIHLVGVTGSEGSYSVNGTALIGVPLSGNDALWSADVFYRWYLFDAAANQSYMLGAFTGYGGRSVNLNTNSLGQGSVSGSSNGIRFGVEGSFPFKSGWAINASVSYEPSDTLTGSLFNALGTNTSGSVSATGQGWDYVASVSYTTTSDWVFTLGYWWSQDNLGPASNANGIGVCPCSVTWQGPYLQVGKQF